MTRVHNDRSLHNDRPPTVVVGERISELLSSETKKAAMYIISRQRR